MSDAVYADTIPAYAHGRTFIKDPPAFIVVHSTEGPMSDGNARALASWFARSPANGGPGTSATDIFDPIEGIRMLDSHTTPYHCGPYGNPRGTGSEHCGSVKLTKEQWLSDRAKAMLDRSARRNAQLAHERGWTLAQCRWLTVSEVARFVPGFCTHNDIRLALGGTTHSDPGPNFPYAWYMERVRFWFQNPSGITQEDDDFMADPTAVELLQTIAANTKKAADNDEKTYLYGVRAIGPDGNIAPSQVNNSLYGVVKQLLEVNRQLGLVLEALNVEPEPAPETPPA